MAISIPSTEAPDVSFLRNFKEGGDLLQNLMAKKLQAILHRESLDERFREHEQQLAQRQQEHQDTFGLQQQNFGLNERKFGLEQQAEARQQAYVDAQIKKIEYETNPAKQANMMKSMLEALGGGSPSLNVMGTDVSQALVNPPSKSAVQGGFGGLNSAQRQLVSLMTGKNIPELPEEKAARDVETHRTNKQADETVKRLAENKDLTKELVNFARAAQESEKLLLENPGLTGPSVSLRKKLPFTPGLSERELEALGQLGPLALTLQGNEIQKLGQRGGAVLANIVKSGKIDESNPYKFNVGAIKSIKNELLRSFEQQAKEHEELTGQPYPIDYKDLLKSYEAPSALNEKRKVAQYAKELKISEKDLKDTMKDTGLSVDEVRKYLLNEGAK